MTRAFEARWVLVAMSIAVACYGLGPSAQADVVYSETFDGASVPANWFAQPDGSAGLATLGIVDDTAGIGTGNTLSIDAAERQGTIGTFDEVSFANVGDVIELSFDARLLAFPGHPSGFRFGLYHDNDGQALDSGYRTFIGTGGSLRTTVQADGGDDVNGDIVFGVNRENPPGFELVGEGAGLIDDTEPHSFLLMMTRTADGVFLEPFQNGESILPEGTEHIPGTGAGVEIPLQLRFNEVAFSTFGGITGMIDNIQVTFTPAATVVPGDFDGDGDVDGADFVVWQTNFPTQEGATLATGDADGDGDVDGADFVIWQTNFPFTPAASSEGVSPVPEPASAWLLLVGGMAAAFWRRRQCASRPV